MRFIFFFQAEDGIRDPLVTGVQTCALPISGVFLLAALGLASGLASGGALTARATPLIGLVFLALTTALLVLDLKRPERFLYLLFMPNWRSWLVWGGWILVAQGALGA